MFQFPIKIPEIIFDSPRVFLLVSYPNSARPRSLLLIAIGIGDFFSLGYPKAEEFYFWLEEGLLQYFSGCPKGFGQFTRCR